MPKTAAMRRCPIHVRYGSYYWAAKDLKRDQRVSTISGRFRSYSGGSNISVRGIEREDERHRCARLDTMANE